MSLSDLITMHLRRWWITLPLIALTIGAVFVTSRVVRPNYYATSYVALIPPAATPYKPGTPVQYQRNTWLGQKMSLLGDAGAVSVSEASTADLMRQRGLSDSYTLTIAERSGQGTFEVVANSPEQAQGTMEALVKLYSDAIAAVQQSGGVSVGDQIITQVIGDPLNLVKATGNVKRTYLAVGLTGLLITMTIVAAVDFVLRRNQSAPEPVPSSRTPAAPSPNLAR